jgi:hypothetical protein
VAKTAKFLRYASRTVLVIVSSFWFVFALLSGSEEYGGGIKGIMMNSPNALPWLLLGVLVYVAFKWELVGGLLIVGMGVLTVFFFNAYKSAFVFFAISVPLVILGGFLIASWYLTKQTSE